MNLHYPIKSPVVFFPFIGDTIGGSHISALSLIKELRKHQNFPPIIGIHDTGGPLACYLQECETDFVKVPKVDIVDVGPLITQIKATIKVAKPLARFLKTQNISIVHINDIRCLYMWALATKMAGKKLVWHQRTSSASLRVAFLSLFMDALVAISDYTKQQMRYPARLKAQVIHDPVTLTHSAEDIVPHNYHKHLGLLTDTFIVGTVGNLTPQKRPDFILEIAKRIGEHPRKFAFIIIGAVRDEYGRHIAQRIQDEGLEKRIFLLGKKFPIDSYMKGFDCLLAPAINEGFGRTLPEAFLCRIPVIASAHAGHLEIIQHENNGFVVDPYDIDAYAKRLKTLSGKNISDFSPLLDYAQKYAQQNFSLKEHANKVQALYRSLSSNGKTLRS